MEQAKLSLRDKPAARWGALALLSLTMFFAYMFVDVLSPVKTLVETELGWDDEELATNPFLRSHLPALARHLPGVPLPEGASAFEVFVALRQWRNGFRPPAIN